MIYTLYLAQTPIEAEASIKRHGITIIGRYDMTTNLMFPETALLVSASMGQLADLQYEGKTFEIFQGDVMDRYRTEGADFDAEASIEVSDD